MPMCIAVIDDDSACRVLFYHLLSEEGYTVYLLPDSATALQSLHALAPAAIILDLRLENPTAGWEVIRYVRRDPALSATPVLVCSADLRALEEGAAVLKQLGAMMLAKPFDIDELLVLLQQLLCDAPPASPASRCVERRVLDHAGS